jgi:hypothetical protein
MRSPMTWYQTFNTTEALLWGIVACVILLRTPCESRQQRVAVTMAFLAFLAFGVSDMFEALHTSGIPGWLWGMKIACGAAILASRYTWLGWERFSCRDREFLFGVFLLAATVGVIVLQVALDTGGPGGR